MARKKGIRVRLELLVPILFAIVVTLGVAVFSRLSGLQSPDRSDASTVVLAKDSFSRTDSGGWGNSDFGGNYTRDSKDASVRTENGYGVIAIPYLRSYAHLSLDSVRAENYYGYFNFRLNKLPSKGYVDISTQVRRVNSGLYYKMTISVSSQGDIKYNVSKVTPQGESLILVSTLSSSTRVVAREWYRVKYQVAGSMPTFIKARIWNLSSGQAEPEMWAIESKDSSSELSGPYGVGLSLRYRDSNIDEFLRVEFDDLLVESTSNISPEVIQTNTPEPTNVTTSQPSSSQSTGNSKIILRANGSIARNEYPLLILTLNGQQIGNARVTGTMSDYIINAPRKIVSGDKVRVYFVNDYSDSTTDRNARIDSISIDGTVYQSEQNAIFSTGTWTSVNGCAPGYKSSEYLHCGAYAVVGNLEITNPERGYFEYVVGNSTPSVSSSPKLTAAPATPVSETPVPPQSGSCTPFYTANSPWNTRITTNPRYQRDSVFYVSENSSQALQALYINGSLLKLYSDTSQYSYPIYEVNNRTSKTKVYLTGVYSEVIDTDADGKEDVTKRHRAGTAVVDLPMPAAVEASRGTDGQIIILNKDTGEEWGFWQVKYENGRYNATNGYYYNIKYSGYPPSSLTNSEARFLSRGAGIPYLTGVVRPCEIVQGKINHALAFAYPKPHSDFVYPATKSDGCPSNRSDVGTCRSYDLPEGSRLQLDPTISDDEIRSWGCRDACFTIAKAMQEYGMIVMDISGRAKIASEDNKTAKWTSLPVQYQVTEKTVNPIPLNRMKLVEFPYQKNCLVQNGQLVCR